MEQQLRRSTRKTVNNTKINLPKGLSITASSSGESIYEAYHSLFSHINP